MTVPGIDASAVIEPIRQLSKPDTRGVLAVITGIEGPSYRPLGAMMAIMGNGRRVGTLSSGCIEADIALHANTALAEGKARSVLYGKGSPYIDIALPCGGGLEITLLPNPDKAVLAKILAQHDARQPATFEWAANTGHIAMTSGTETGWADNRFSVGIDPEIMFYIFGKGPEAATFAGMVQATGFPHLVLSPDEETLQTVAAVGCEVQHMHSAHWPKSLNADTRSAVVLFFHDHEWEPPILTGALASDAFYVGAQGSMRAAEERREALRLAGLPAHSIARLKGPIGLIPSARDARKLAVSVLAEILNNG